MQARTILPKLGVFLISALLFGAFAFVVSAASGPGEPESQASERPDFVLTGAGDTPADAPANEAPPAALAAFDLIEAVPAETPVVVPGLPPADLALAAGALLDPPPASWLNPSGFPRIGPITQFDGGPFQGANCTLAAGAMLARLGFGVVTTGSILRTLQDDQFGGTGLDDLATALWRGYGIDFEYGLLRPEQLKSLLAAGYGAVIQGDYAWIPEPLKLQRGFRGGHAIYLDGYYGDGPTPAYYVIDPIGRPNAYEGEWWPASIIDDFGKALGGGTHIRAAWVFPPGGTPPEVVGPDIVALPPSGGDTPVGPGPSVPPDASSSPDSGASPSADAGATPTPGPSGGIPSDVLPEPGDVEPPTPEIEPGIDGPVVVGGLDLIPFLAFCALDPPPPGCPDGIPGVFEVPPILIDLLPGPDIEIVFVDSDRPNVALVGFTVDPATTSDVVFWEADGTPGAIQHASAMAAIPLLGQTIITARLDVLAATQYHFQVIAGNGILGSQSPVGSFTTGDGVATFDVALSSAPNPMFELSTGFSPYLHLAQGGFGEPLIRMDQLAAPCLSIILFGDLDFCADARIASTPDTCQRAEVSYELLGVDHTGVLIRAFPAEPGLNPEGDVVLSTVLEAEGPAGSGDVSVGCLASGVSYHVVLDAVGDARGILASRLVTVP
jgi:hypothetical protein